MNLIELLVVLIGITSLALLTVYKYSLDIAYEEWVSKNSIKLLPEKFCTQCFATQFALITSTIIVLSLGLPLWYIIILTLSTAPYVIFLINRI